MTTELILCKQSATIWRVLLIDNWQVTCQSNFLFNRRSTRTIELFWEKFERYFKAFLSYKSVRMKANLVIDMHSHFGFQYCIFVSRQRITIRILLRFLMQWIESVEQKVIKHGLKKKKKKRKKKKKKQSFFFFQYTSLQQHHIQQNVQTCERNKRLKNRSHEGLCNTVRIKRRRISLR